MGSTLHPALIFAHSGSCVAVYQKHFHSRLAALARLKMAKSSSDPKVVAALIDAAADLKDQAGDLPPPIEPSDIVTVE